MSKACSWCNTPLTYDNATQSEIAKNGYCRDCKREYNRQYQQGIRVPRELRIPRPTRQSENNAWNAIKYTNFDVKTPPSKTQRKLYRNHYFANHPCVDCGNDDIRVLELDHIGNEKSWTPSEMWFKASQSEIELELSRCESVCANCHRIRTATRAKNGRWLTAVPDELNDQLLLLNRDLDHAIAS